MPILNHSDDAAAAVDTRSGSNKPIPAFYCCYLLRSTVNHGKLYIGSTPNPRRRLAQHNGITSGGAKRTANLRPWEMVMIVEGFMSRIGALQFEWSWQNTGHCRHIDLKERDATHQSRARINPKSGTKKHQSGLKTRTSLTSHLGDLHVLLRSTYFQNWPLKVRFFSEDVYRVWQGWSDRVDGLVPDNIEIISPQHGGNIRSAETVDSSYNSMRDYLEKARSVLDSSRNIHCGVCKKQLQLKNQMIVVCPIPSCRSASHLICLSSRFLQESGVPDKIVPSEGTCSACEETVQWPTLMKELTLRSRGENENQPHRKRIRRHAKEENATAGMHVDLGRGRKRLLDEQQGLPRPPVDDQMNFNGAEHREGAYGEYEQDDEPLDDNWMDALDIDSDSESNDQPGNRAKTPQTRVEIVIEDSDCDEPEIID